MKKRVEHLNIIRFTDKEVALLYETLCESAFNSVVTPKSKSKNETRQALLGVAAKILKQASRNRSEK